MERSAGTIVRIARNGRKDEVMDSSTVFRRTGKAARFRGLRERQEGGCFGSGRFVTRPSGEEAVQGRREAGQTHGHLKEQRVRMPACLTLCIEWKRNLRLMGAGSRRFWIYPGSWPMARQRKKLSRLPKRSHFASSPIESKKRKNPPRRLPSPSKQPDREPMA